MSKNKIICGGTVLRVISGSARGKKLCTLEGNDVRPTLDRVKESIFNMIAFDLPDACVLDLFCGSGALGIEALSRGAKNAVFVDNSNESISVCKKNVSATRFDEKSQFILSDSIYFLETTDRTFDFIFIDPPYESPLYQQALDTILARKLLSSGGQVVVECDKIKTPELDTSGFVVLREKTYGRVKILIMKG